jgi:zinc transporter 1
LNDLVGFIVAFAAFKVRHHKSSPNSPTDPSTKISERENSPDALSFGWQRASLLGAFFNGTFLVALGVSIFLQSVERFVSLQSTTPFDVVEPY